MGILNPAVRAAHQGADPRPGQDRQPALRCIEGCPRCIAEFNPAARERGAAELALGCDIRLAAAHATSAPEALWGAFPSGGRWAPAIVGRAAPRLIARAARRRGGDGAPRPRPGRLPCRPRAGGGPGPGRPHQRERPPSPRGAQANHERRPGGVAAGPLLSDALRHALEWTVTSTSGMAAHREGRRAIHRAMSVGPAADAGRSPRRDGAMRPTLGSRLSHEHLSYVCATRSRDELARALVAGSDARDRVAVLLPNCPNGSWPRSPPKIGGMWRRSAPSPRPASWAGCSSTPMRWRSSRSRPFGGSYLEALHDLCPELPRARPERFEARDCELRTVVIRAAAWRVFQPEDSWGGGRPGPAALRERPRSVSRVTCATSCTPRDRRPRPKGVTSRTAASSRTASTSERPASDSRDRLWLAVPSSGRSGRRTRCPHPDTRRCAVLQGELFEPEAWSCSPRRCCVYYGMANMGPPCWSIPIVAGAGSTPCARPDIGLRRISR